MLAVKARYDGRRVILPTEARRAPRGEVIVVFTDWRTREARDKAWLKAQEAAFAKVWDNGEDAIYDRL
jgi:hypothetical protein